MTSVNINPSLWGPKFWHTIFSFVAVYPNNPDDKYIKACFDFFNSLVVLLPCCACRNSYVEYINENDTNINNLDNFNSRNALITFVYLLRNKVNNKLGITYCVTKHYFTKKLEHMLCSQNNYLDYYLNNVNDAPILQNDIKHKILQYIYTNRDMIHHYDSKYTKNLLYKLKQFVDEPIFDINNKNFNLWLKRNIECRNIINRIYKNMSVNDYTIEQSFIRDKKDHIILFYMGCSIISSDVLNKLLV